MWQYHNTIGAMDGMHVAIKKSAKSGSAFWNDKKFNSIILMGIVNAQYKFLWIDIGANGLCGDSTIWNDSDLKSAIRNHTLGLPPPEPLPKDNIRCVCSVNNCNEAIFATQPYKRTTDLQLPPVASKAMCRKCFWHSSK